MYSFDDIRKMHKDGLIDNEEARRMLAVDKHFHTGVHHAHFGMPDHHRHDDDGTPVVD